MTRKARGKRSQGPAELQPCPALRFVLQRLRTRTTGNCTSLDVGVLAALHEPGVTREGLDRVLSILDVQTMTEEQEKGLRPSTVVAMAKIPDVVEHTAAAWAARGLCRLPKAAKVA